MKKWLIGISLLLPVVAQAQVQLTKNVQLGGTSSSGATTTTGVAPIVVSPTTGNVVVSIGGSCQTITTSGTPAFAFTTTCAKLTLTSNVSSGTTSGAVFGLTYNVEYIQDGMGGRTFIAPTAFKGGPVTINTAANGKTFCNYFAAPDGNLYLQGVCTWF